MARVTPDPSFYASPGPHRRHAGHHGVVALLVYERLGVSVLRRVWVNMDAIWAVAVVAAGLATLFT